MHILSTCWPSGHWCVADVRLSHHPGVHSVDREHLTVVREAADAALADASPAINLDLAQSMMEHHPLDAPLQARVIRLLAAPVRQAEAFAGVQQRLWRKLGLDPSTELVHPATTS